MIVKSKRLSLNMSQEKLASEIGVSRSTIASWETCTAFPRIEKLKKLAELFGCSVNELLEGWEDGKE